MKLLLTIVFLAWALVVSVVEPSLVQAQTKTSALSWQDNSADETGFNVERGAVTAGPFTKIGETVTNVANYVDGNLPPATQFCYRVNAFNSAGPSGYSNVACTTTPATLTVTKAGTGTGTTSASGEYAGGSVVTLIATPNAGSIFVGWSGNADCLDGSVTMTANISCTATFNLAPPPVAPGTLIVTTVDANGKPVTIIIPGTVGP